MPDLVTKWEPAEYDEIKHQEGIYLSQAYVRRKRAHRDWFNWALMDIVTFESIAKDTSITKTFYGSERARSFTHYNYKELSSSISKIQGREYSEDRIVVLLKTGLGKSYPHYPAFIGYNKENKPCQLVIDFKRINWKSRRIQIIPETNIIG